jgi:ATP-binding cassette subfamily C protein LapB
MKAFFVNFIKHPIIALEIIIATFFIAVLTLSSPLFVIQVLNRYITHGFSGTLITLTAGMLIAIALQFAFRLVRTRLASTINHEPDQIFSEKVFSILSQAYPQPISRIAKPKLQETINGLQIIRSAHSAPSINTILDAPFAFLFVLVVFYISPVLALIALGGIVLSLFSGIVALLISRGTNKALQNITIAHRGMVQSILNNIDTVRVFKGQNFLKPRWDKQSTATGELQSKDANIKEFSQSLTMALNLLMTVTLYATGAVQVVDGFLSVGGLIGANILAGRAFSSTTRFVQVCYLLNKAKGCQRELQQLFKLPVEPAAGSSLAEYSGSLQLKDLSFRFKGSSGPLFESINLNLLPGETLGITGYNGSGKTTFMRLITGLLHPPRGAILIDGVDLRQIAPEWWRNQICYLPQEPLFLNATIYETITMINSDIDVETINKIISLADLKNFLNSSPQGLKGVITENGRYLPAGIRRRIALARAITANGRLVLFDEPTEGLDESGCQAVYKILNQMTHQGKTIIVVSRDHKILRGAHKILNLSIKPVPVIGIGPYNANLKDKKNR